MYVYVWGGGGASRAPLSSLSPVVRDTLVFDNGPLDYRRYFFKANFLLLLSYSALPRCRLCGLNFGGNGVKSFCYNP